jgi:hypothetical protein
MVYAPPVLDVNTPSGVLLATCGASGLGLAVVVAAAWYIGVRAQRRAIYKSLRN